MMDFKIVIPARMASTRLPGKPLLLVGGLPMVVRVMQLAQQSGASEVVVATDEAAVVETVQAYSGEALMTSADHATGTDRIAEVARLKGWSEDTVVVNVQGDEPLTDSEHIYQLAQLLADDSVLMGTLASPLVDSAQLQSPHVVKVVLNHQNDALYFSRSMIPFDRDGRRQSDLSFDGLRPWRHVGMYAYRVKFLQDYVKWPVAPIEQLECLEQLRALYHGVAIRVGLLEKPAAPGVDTQADLEWVNRLLTERLT